MIDRFAPICLENHPLISLSEDISLSERMLFVDFLSFAHKGIPRTIPNALLNQDIASLFDAVNPSVCLSKPRWFESRLVIQFIITLIPILSVFCQLRKYRLT